MKCDRCREQLPVVDGIDHNGQTLCLECAMRGSEPCLAQRTELSQDAMIRKNIMRPLAR